MPVNCFFDKHLHCLLFCSAQIERLFERSFIFAITVVSLNSSNAGRSALNKNILLPGQSFLL